MFYKTVRRFVNPDGSQGGAPSGEQTDQQSQQNVAPVSYIHLDVYKRQVCHRGKSPEDDIRIP